MSFCGGATILFCGNLLYGVSAMRFVAFVVSFELQEISVLNRLFILYARCTPSGDCSFSQGYVCKGRCAPPGTITRAPVVYFMAGPNLSGMFLFRSFTCDLLCRYIVALNARAGLGFFGSVVPRSALTRMDRASTSPVCVIFRCVLRVITNRIVGSGRAFTYALHLLLFVNRFPFFCFSIVLLDRMF